MNLPGDLKDMDRSFRALKRRMAEDRVSAKKARRNAYLRSHAIEIGEVAPGVEYWIVGSPMDEEFRRMQASELAGELPSGFCERSSIGEMVGSLNGYVAFPKRRAPLRVPKLFDEKNGLLDYIPVHGGVTYSCKDATGCVFGFDTAHFGSKFIPRTERLAVPGALRRPASSVEDRECLLPRANERGARRDPETSARNDPGRRTRNRNDDSDAGREALRNRNGRRPL